MGIFSSGKVQDTVRAGEIERHKLEMLFVNVFMVLAIAGTISAFVVLALMPRSASENYNVYLLQKNIIARAKLVTGIDSITNSPMSFRAPNGIEKDISARSVVALTQDRVSEVGTMLTFKLAAWWILWTAALAAGVVYFLYKKGKSHKKDEFLRGAVIVEPHELAEQLVEAGRASQITVGGVPTVKGCEMLNFLISGSMGTGKSVLIFEMLTVLRRLGKKVFIYDPSGEFAEKFYRAGKDHILNPLDKRGVNWSIFNEARSPIDWETISAAVIKEDKNNTFFSDNARAIFSETAKKLLLSGDASLANLLDWLIVKPLVELHGLLKGTVAGPLTDPASAETASDIRSTLAQNLRALYVMREHLEGAGGEPFSIRKWIEDEEDDSWVFITARKDTLETLRPLITTYVAVAITGVLSGPVVRYDKVWLLLDEIANLNKLKDLPMLMSEGRKHGAAVVLGIQLVAMLREIYGKDLSQVLTAGCQNWVIFRTKDPETCKFLSDGLGKKEIEEKDMSMSYGAAENRDGVSVATKRVEKVLVMPDEILKLPTFVAYLSLAEHWPITKVKVEIQNLPSLAEPFEPVYEILRPSVPKVSAGDAERVPDSSMAGAEYIEKAREDGELPFHPSTPVIPPRQQNDFIL